MSRTDMEHRFGFHAATTKEKKMEHNSVRISFLNMAIWLDSELPDGREKATALTNLEQAMFWSNAAVARNVPAPPSIVRDTDTHPSQSH